VGHAQTCQKHQNGKDLKATGDYLKGAGSRETGTLLMAIHKQILEWQAAHPNITWIGWGIVWAIVLVILFWPRALG
jgi:hypothetical protein